MEVITFFNNKGGVGKTTLAVNVAAYFSINFDKKVLFLDADPQANSTQMMISDSEWENYYGSSATETTLLNYLGPIEEGDSNLDFTSSPIDKDRNRFNVDLIPGHPRLSIIEDNLSDAWNKCISGDLGGFRRTNWLNALTDHYKDDYDYLFIDVGPSLGALNRSVLLNTHYIVTPMGSDIFSLIGVDNISNWMGNWMRSYRYAIDLLFQNQDEAKILKYQLKLDISSAPNLIGYSIQQYVTKKFAQGRRPIQAYERIISKTSSTISDNLKFLIPDNVSEEMLNLGDVPYLYSLVPLAQSSNSPMFLLKSSDGITGGQPSQVKKYDNMINIISTNIINNIEAIK